MFQSYLQFMWMIVTARRFWIIEVDDFEMYESIGLQNQKNWDNEMEDIRQSLVLEEMKVLKSLGN